jgi:hypothetical protein
LRAPRPWKDEPAFKVVLDEIRTQNDRCTAIVAVATLEYALVLAIEARCSPISNKCGRFWNWNQLRRLIDFAAKIKRH